MIFNTYSPEKSSNQTDSLIIIFRMTKPIGTFHKEAKPQEVAEKAAFSQTALSKHIDGELTGGEKHGRKKVHKMS